MQYNHMELIQYVDNYVVNRFLFILPFIHHFSYGYQLIVAFLFGLFFYFVSILSLHFTHG